MTQRQTTKALLALVLTASILAAIQLAGPVRPAKAASAVPTAAALRICSSCDSYLGDSTHYQYMILQTRMHSAIPTLKANNPGLKVLVYKDAIFANQWGSSDPKYLISGVGYYWANANHPDWFLTDTSGQRIESATWPGNWLMDVANPAYQQQWVKNVVADAKKLGFDGVYMDDADDGGSMWPHLSGKTIAKYPTADSWNQAMTSFMAAVAPQLRAAGLLVLPNIAISDWWTSNGLATWDRWVGYSSGGVQQYYSKWGRGSSRWFTDDGGAHNNWTYRQAFFQHTQAAGKIFLGSTFAPMDDSRSMRYARASFLLDWNGGASALVFEPSYPDAQDPYSPVWTADLGTPLGAKYKVGVAWRRDYSGGTVVLNPSPTTSQEVSLGSSFVTADGSTVSSVDLPPTQAAILSASSAPPPPPPPPPPPTSAPVNTTPPSISVAHGGELLVGYIGAWSGSPTSFAYAWLHCDATGGACTAIAGATAQSYTVSAEDVGSTLRFRVTASNAAGSAFATSAATSVVQARGGGKLIKRKPTGAGAVGSRAKAAGAIRTHRAFQWFTVRQIGKTVRVRYYDPRGNVVFRSLRVTSARLGRHVVVFGGRAVVHGRKNGRVWFSVRLHDRSSQGRADRFSIRLSNAYHRSARLAKGAITVR